MLISSDTENEIIYETQKTEKRQNQLQIILMSVKKRQLKHI